MDLYQGLALALEHHDGDAALRLVDQLLSRHAAALRALQAQVDDLKLKLAEQQGSS